jgi:hypothetical protein
VNSGRNQDLGREGLATAEKLGNLKSWAPRPRRRGFRPHRIGAQGNHF